jgi:hypothetical protein
MLPRPILAVSTALAAAGLLSLSPLPAADAPSGLWSHDNIDAWCIVPYDSKKRGPEERAQMLESLGLKKLAYDWRQEHIPTFDAEIEALQRHHIELTAWWFPTGMNELGRKTLAIFKAHGVHPQLWVCGPGKAALDTPEGPERIEVQAGRIRPIAQAAAEIGCKVALYNHREPWFEEQDNQIAIIERLKRDGITNVGIVFNFHHWHGDLAQFPALFKRMQPYLIAVNLNGMPADTTKPTGVNFVGTGQSEEQMMKVVQESGWRGPIGIINEHADLDAADVLARNLAGVDRIASDLRAAK